jgi:signal transduction histidine kinase
MLAAGRLDRGPVEPREGVCALWIENPAPDLDAGDVDKLVEPFWRASRARESREHAGLGLALVRRLSEILGADLTFRVEQGTFRVTLLFRDSRASAA